MAKRHDPDLYHTQSPLPVRLIERRRVSVLIRLLAMDSTHHVLEVGCGAGNVLERIADGRRTGIDLSDYLLKKAANRLGVKACLVRMNAEKLGFEDASFDRVFCTEVLEHVQDPRAVLQEMKRVLSPAGQAVVSVPNEGLINRVKQMAFAVPGARALFRKFSGYDMPEHMEDEWHLHEFDRALLEKTTAGLFTVIKLAGIPSRALPLRWVALLRPCVIEGRRE